MSNIFPCIANGVVSETGERFASITRLATHLGVSRKAIARLLKKNGVFEFKGHQYYLLGEGTAEIAEGKNFTFTPPTPTNGKQQQYVGDEFIDADPKLIEEFKAYKNGQELPFEKYDFKMRKHKNGMRYCVALFSDLHVGETIDPRSVLNMNEYNLEIAKERVQNYFENLVSCINHDHVNNLVFACLGDLINNYIHESYMVENQITPLEEVIVAQSLVYNGLEFLCQNTKLEKILFIGIVGNHGRTTKKTWSSGAYKMSYEWLIYKNVENMCRIKGLPIEFNIPCSDMTIVDMNDGNRFAFFHGEQVRGGTGIAGPINTLSRYYLKLKRTLEITKFYCGHFHQCISVNGVVCNGSVCGFNNFSLSNGFTKERPQQMYELFDSEIGLLLTRQIYCD